MAKFQAGDKAYIVENNRNVREVTVMRCSGGMYLIKFENGGGIQVKEHRLFASESEANPGLIDRIGKAQRNMLWMNKNLLDTYEELPKTNVRLEELKEKAFLTGAEKYLWVPPARPYYPLQGVYKDSQACGCGYFQIFNGCPMLETGTVLESFIGCINQLLCTVI